MAVEFNEEYFDQGVFRMGTRCEKWDTMRRLAGDPGMLPFWVADMDFPSPPAVAQALVERAAHPVYGYTEIEDDDYAAAADFWRRRHGIVYTKEELTFLPCVITGLKVAIRACTQPGDGVVVMSPVYGPFRFSVQATGRTLVTVPLVPESTAATLRGDGALAVAPSRMRMDLPGIERALAAGAKAVMLCNPHNPVGRCWTRAELEELVACVSRHGATLISDEIHADFIYPGHTFTPALSLASDKVVSLFAASKTFNLAGLQQAMCACRDGELRAAIRKAIDEGGVRSGNLFALEGTRAAYQTGDAWLDGLVRYLDGNRAELARLVAEKLPKAVLYPLEATYLAWLDLRAYGFSEKELMARCAKAGVKLSEGSFFGADGEGFMRFNIGCPRRYLVQGIDRLAQALQLA